MKEENFNSIFIIIGYIAGNAMVLLLQHFGYLGVCK